MSGKHKLLKKIVTKEMFETLNNLRADYNLQKVDKHKKKADNDQKMMKMRTNLKMDEGMILKVTSSDSGTT